MSKNELAVLVRYALMILAGRVSMGWLPEDVALQIAMDPVVTEIVAGALIALGTYLYYRLRSFSRKALAKAESEGL